MYSFCQYMLLGPTWGSERKRSAVNKSVPKPRTVPWGKYRLNLRGFDFSSD